MVEGVDFSQGMFVWNNSNSRQRDNDDDELSTSEDSFDSNQSQPKRIKLMSMLENPQQGGGAVNLSEESSPLGLTLRKTPSFLDLIQAKLFPEKQISSVKFTKSEEPSTQTKDSLEQQEKNEKWKASNFNAVLLRIGTWERVSKRDGDVVAKCYFSKRKLVWEILEGGLKSKLELQFSDISALRAVFPENGHEVLEIELKKVPTFFGEINPQPRKHTIWQPSSDFTGGQATLNRRHYVQFAKGSMGKHYEKLLQCDEGLMLLSKRHFPSYISPYFHFNFGGSDVSEYHDFQPQFTSTMMQVPSFHRIQTMGPRVQPMTSMDLASPMSVMEFPHSGNHSFEYQRELFRLAMENQVQAPLFCSQPNQVGYSLSQNRPSHPPRNNSALKDLADHLLYDPVPSACSDEQKLMARVKSMASLLQLQNEQTAVMNTSQFRTDYIQDKSSNCSTVSSISNQSYGDSGLISQESGYPEHWQPGLGFDDFENPDISLPRNSSFSYMVPNQLWDDLAAGETYRWMNR